MLNNNKNLRVNMQRRVGSRKVMEHPIKYIRIKWANPPFMKKKAIWFLLCLN